MSLPTDKKLILRLVNPGDREPRKRKPRKVDWAKYTGGIVVGDYVFVPRYASPYKIVDICKHGDTDEIILYVELPSGVTRYTYGVESVEKYTGSAEDRMKADQYAHPELNLQYGSVKDSIYWQIYAQTKKNAKRRNIKFQLTREEMLKLIQESNGRCMLTHIEFTDKKVAGVAKRPWLPSLDRIDSLKGYAPTNCRLVCVAVNLALHQFGDQVLIDIATAMHKLRIERGENEQTIIAR
jgi:hypothetical protein